MQDPRSVERLGKGDVATLKRLFKTNYAKLYPMAFRLTRNREAAATVIRSAFRRLWEERAELDPFERIDTRLVAHAYAEAAAYRSSNGVTGFALASEEDADESRIQAEIGQISEDDLLAYLLFVVDGYSFRELARAFDTTVDDVRLSVGRALTQLEESPEFQEH